ncbi:MAG TPA: hypothetical protein PLT76_08750 [Candidatus Omnitrophota bacterium]|nr:hypothetical protein [Candidatus Omnitrophota bacterium]HQO58791.1 hypothetical protein [Candidatus Omnitrophota bacterium]
MKSQYCLLLIAVLLLAGCGTLNVYVKPGTNFNRNTTITVIGGEDRSGTKGQIEHLLLSRGFNIVSESTARNAIKYRGSLKGTDVINNEYIAETYSIREINSVYALEMNYSYYWDVFYWAYTRFSAKVTDLNNGEVVLTAQFSGDRSVNSVLNELVNKIDAQVR